MPYRLLADLVLILHAGFVAFVMLGALLVLRWPRIAWAHVPVALWGAGIEFLGGICPLTPLENHWRRLAGELGYPGGFIEHYFLAVLYPDGLTRRVQLCSARWCWRSTWRSTPGCSGVCMPIVPVRPRENEAGRRPNALRAVQVFEAWKMLSMDRSRAALNSASDCWAVRPSVRAREKLATMLCWRASRALASSRE